ncbi:MAG: 50S ribosomal protein L30 [Armatimonadetes bacterium]|nr:50S ribosomal protein L30 [Armatimonadota bacterium]
MSEQRLKITLVRSVIGNTQRQRAVVRSLGLGRLNSSVVQPDRPEIRGMCRSVAHLVQVEEIGAAEAGATAAGAAVEGAEE